MTRRAEPRAKQMYELDDFVVHLENYKDDTGFYLSGFVHGFDDAQVLLFGSDYVGQTSIKAGTFAFKDLPADTYRLSFSVAGEDYWINDLDLREDSSR
jgi:hypothetical protein